MIYLSRGLTFAYFALALSCLWLDMAQLLAVLHRLGAPGLVGAYLGLAAATGAAFWAWDALTKLVIPLRHKVTDVSSGVMARNLSLALQILLIVTVASFFHKAPEFVYRAF